MKSLLPLLVTLVLQSVCMAVAAILGLESVRPDPAIAVIAFAAVRLDPVAAVVAASAIGFCTDLMAVAPLGLHMLAYTVAYLVARVISDVLGVTRTGIAVPLVLGLSFASRVILLLLLVLFADGGARLRVWPAIVPSILIDAAIAVPIWLLLDWLYRRLVPEAEMSWRRA